MLVPGSANPLLLRTVAAAAAGGISRSLRFNSSDSAYLSRTPASAGNRKTWTWAGWVKKARLADEKIFAGGTSIGATTFLQIFFGSTGTLRVSSGSNDWVETTQVFRDSSAWYHFVVALDTTQATGANRLKLYVNGVEITTFSTDNRAANISQNTDYGININAAHHIGSFQGSSGFFSGYLADVYFIDGQALTPSSFTETDATTAQLIPKAYTGSYGTNGFHLEFADNSSNTATTLGKDTSGNGNNWTPNNLSVTAGAGNDSLVDVPTNGAQTDTGVGGEVRGNYATLNPLQTASGATLTNGNLDVSTTSTSWQPSVSSIFQASGKWYAEFTVTSSTAGGFHIGIVGPGFSVAAGNYIGVTATSYAYRGDGGSKYNNATQASYGASYTTGDVVGVAMDLDAGTLVFYKNGASQGTAYTGMTGEKAFAVSVGGTAGTHAGSWNFGQRPFAYTAPSGFKALCTANLPAPLVTKPNTVMDVKLYTGNGSTQTISGLGFSPDLVWIKSRSTSDWHALFDVVRGATAYLSSNVTNAESSNASSLTSFDSTGFTLGSFAPFNGSSATYAAWTWDAGSSTVTNTQGSITSSVRANATAGFSIVTYTGSGANSTIGHGLGVAPQFIITKSRSSSAFNWGVYHASAGNTGYLKLNLTDAFATQATWQNTTPTSAVFYVGNFNSANQGGDNYVAYCFAPVVGYSSMGSYVGNGVDDGPFVYTGFRPRWIMIKHYGGSISAQSNAWWMIVDTARDTVNVVNNRLHANSSDFEYSGTAILDVLSNGFKLRRGPADVWNYSGGNYLYCAFAESPFNYARAR